MTRFHEKHMDIFCRFCSTQKIKISTRYFSCYCDLCGTVYSMDDDYTKYCAYQILFNNYEVEIDLEDNKTEIYKDSSLILKINQALDINPGNVKLFIEQRLPTLITFS